ncbi:MAG: ribbon-helix-helix protein, CopG family [Cyanobacteriota bacterium]|jgi:predicted transcriptional regulator
MERLELRLGDKLSADLKELATKNETTKTEIIKRALALYSWASVENDKGTRIFLRDSVSERELIAL